jgi:hypothetical protein
VIRDIPLQRLFDYFQDRNLFEGNKAENVLQLEELKRVSFTLSMTKIPFSRWLSD